MKKYNYQIMTIPYKHWDEIKQFSVELPSQHQAVMFAKILAKLHQKEVRMTIDDWDNGHYFHHTYADNFLTQNANEQVS